VLEVEQLLKESKDVFAWTYKDFKGIPLELAQHKIELDTIIPPAIIPNYVIEIKKYIDKLLAIGLIQSI